MSKEAREVRDFASLMVDEVIARTRLQLDAGIGLSVEDQRNLLDQLVKDRERLHASPLSTPLSADDAGLCERLRADDRDFIQRLRIHATGLKEASRYDPARKSDLTNADIVSYGELIDEAARRIEALSRTANEEA